MMFVTTEQEELIRERIDIADVLVQIWHIAFEDAAKLYKAHNLEFNTLVEDYNNGPATDFVSLKRAQAALIEHGKGLGDLIDRTNAALAEVRKRNDAWEKKQNTTEDKIKRGE